MAKMFRRIWSFSKPLIAAVKWRGAAGGCGIATLCDFTLARARSEIGYTEVKIGFLPAIGFCFLSRKSGKKELAIFCSPEESSSRRKAKEIA